MTQKVTADIIGGKLVIALESGEALEFVRRHLPS